MPANRKTSEISITRVYDAPLEAVWEAWTDPDQVAQWWGPRGFTLTTHSKDLKPGGIWAYTMHGPDGADYPNETLYHEVEKHRKLVYDHGAGDGRPPLFRVTVLFAESDGKTTMEMTMSLPTAEEAERTRQFIKRAGGNATWDRLAEYLDQTRSGRRTFVINRSFGTIRELLFDLWTNPEHLAKWLPPHGFEVEFLETDIREGGGARFRMSNDAGTEFYGRFEYRIIDRPRRIAYVQRFCDAAGNVTRHPGMPVFPEALLTTVNFAEEGDRSTRLTLTSEPLDGATAAEIAAFVDERDGMTRGWTGSFDELEALLSSRVGVA